MGLWNMDYLHFDTHCIGPIQNPSENLTRIVRWSFLVRLYRDPYMREQSNNP